MKGKWVRVLVLGVFGMALASAAEGCFGSGSSTSNSCNAFTEGEANSQCATCVESKCASQISAASGPCSDFVTCACASGGSAQSCASKLASSACQPLSQAVTTCAQTNCSSQCAGVDSGTVDSSTADSSTPVESGKDSTVESGPETSTVDSSTGVDSSVPETSLPETSTVDVQVVETGPEAAADTGVDANDGGCATGKTSCSGVCTDTNTDNANCGSCAKACSGGETCTAGVCGCPTGQTICGTTCTNTSTDSANCGKCANACPAGEVCSAGTCGCPTGEALCSNTCTNTSTDVLNCGSCAKTCGPYLNATPSCGGGQCMYTCLPGFLKCKTATDCSVDTNSDPNNCGGCGKGCPNSPPPNQSPVCNAGACGYACSPPFTTCPGDKLPCFTNLNNSRQNCGSCGNACSGNQFCSNGTCIIGG